IYVCDLEQIKTRNSRQHRCDKRTRHFSDHANRLQRSKWHHRKDSPQRKNGIVIAFERNKLVQPRRLGKSETYGSTEKIGGYTKRVVIKVLRRRIGKVINDRRNERQDGKDQFRTVRHRLL